MIPSALAIDPVPEAEARMTVGEFLVWAEAQPDGARHELVDGRIVEMQSERNRHALVKAEVWRLLRDAVLAADLPCIAFPDGVTVPVTDSHARRPDVALQCGGDIDLDAVTCESPLVLVEIASPSSARVDTTSKLAEYMGLDSVRHYLVIDPEARLAYHHSRSAAGGDIRTRILTDGAFELDPPGISLALADCFADIDRIERPDHSNERNRSR